MNFGADEAQWTRIPIANVEDLRDAVYGAGLDAIQMSRAPVTGNLAFATCDNIMYSTGYFGRASLVGPLSESMVALGLGVILASGTP